MIPAFCLVGLSSLDLPIPLKAGEKSGNSVTMFLAFFVYKETVVKQYLTRRGTYVFKTRRGTFVQICTIADYSRSDRQILQILTFLLG